jgi:trimeric autotransporter adhesin
VDTTTVITGQLTLQKRQALDANCDGTADGAFGTSNITSGAVPGACVRYEITASNTGTAAVSSVVINDSTPTNTVYDNGSRNATGGACGTGAVDAAAATTVGTVSAPACGSAGSVSATVGTLNPGQSAVVTFGVFINNN